MTGARVNDKPSWFIDNDEIVVFKENLERNRLRLGFDFFDRWFGLFDFITAANNLTRPRGCAVELNEPGTDQLLKARARVFWKLPCQKTIEAKACIVF